MNDITNEVKMKTLEILNDCEQVVSKYSPDECATFAFALLSKVTQNTRLHGESYAEDFKSLLQKYIERM